MRPIDSVLSRLPATGLRQHDGYWQARCPAHDDTEPSLTVKEADDGRVLIKCHAGCDTENVLAEMRLTMRNLSPNGIGGDAGGGGSHPSENPETVKPSCSLEGYAEAKRLPIGFLRGLGISQIHLQGEPALRIPYRDAAGEEAATRFRIALNGDDRFRWRKGSKPRPYGSWRLDDAREAGYVVVVEGESDCHTLWHHGIPAIGVPGATNWRPEWSAELDGLEKIYALVEPDRGGEAFWEKLAADEAIRERLYRAELAELGVKDASELHIEDSERFEELLHGALSRAVSWREIADTEARDRAREAWERCGALAQERRILDLFARDLKLSGVAGGPKTGQILCLALNSRHLDSKQLVNVVVKGPSSAGKSFVVEKVLGFFPDDAYHFLTSMSERALAYSEEPLAHRFIVLAEAAGMTGDFGTYLIRSLLSEGRLRYETVEKTASGIKPRLIEREGPTGLIVTTTRIKLHGENETRMLTVRVDDSPDHTREILEALADEDAEPLDTGRWHALQTWIAGGERRVTVPFAKALAREIPTVAVRLRRDFGAVLNLIRSHALLHRATRGLDGRGRIVATLEDYAVVRGLIADLISEGVEATVPPIVRETVEAVRGLTEEADGPVTMAQVGRELALDKNPIYQRVHRAIEGGYLKNLEDRKGRPARLVLGDPMPEDRPVLPEPGALAEALGGSTVSGVSEGIDHPPPPGEAINSPARQREAFTI